jgi:uncharacterized surface protein with fasciclin (FAS1) repeats
MKKNLKLSLLAMLAFVSFATTSCSNDDDDSTPAPKTITQIAQGNANLSLLVQALTKAGLAETLDNAGTYTVFAPNNDAFTAAGYTSTAIAALTTPAEIEGLKNVLLNHVIATKYLASQLTTGYKKTLAVPAADAPNGKIDIYINTTSGVKLNGGANVITPNVNASNGVVHIVDKVIALPTIVTFVGADPNFSSLLAALTRPDQLDEGFATLLSGTASSPFTVFAPTTAAFDSLLTELGPGTTLANIPEQTLTNTLKYHVIAGANVLSSSLSNNLPVSTFLGQNFTIEILPTTGAQIRDASNRVSKIVAVDVQSNNGVVHVIDKVLLPTL